MSSCNDYNSCVSRGQQITAKPTDKESLYADRIYDSQTVNRRCYERNPLQIIEGFGGKGMMGTMLRWGFMLLIVYVIAVFFLDIINPPEEITLGVDTVGTAATGGYGYY